MNVETVEDRLAIRELIETFTIGIMRGDTDLWGSTWAEEGSWTIPLKDEPAVGRANMVALLQQVLARNAFVSMSAFPADLVIQGDRAHGKAYAQELLFPRTGGQKNLIGCFHDEYVKRDGRWYFLSRVYESMWRTELPDPTRRD